MTRRQRIPKDGGEKLPDSKDRLGSVALSELSAERRRSILCWPYTLDDVWTTPVGIWRQPPAEKKPLEQTETKKRGLDKKRELRRREVESEVLYKG